MCKVNLSLLKANCTFVKHFVEELEVLTCHHGSDIHVHRAVKCAFCGLKFKSTALPMREGELAGGNHALDRGGHLEADAPDERRGQADELVRVLEEARSVDEPLGRKGDVHCDVRGNRL